MILRALCAAVGVLFLLLVGVLPAAAHTEAEKVEPANGARLSSMPQQITIHAGGKVKAAYLVVNTPDRRLDDLKATIKGRQVTAPLPANGPRGDYEVAYRLVAMDGHDTAGTVRFTVNQGRAPEVPAGGSELPASQKGPIIALTLAAVAILAVAALAVRGKVGRSSD